MPYLRADGGVRLLRRMGTCTTEVEEELPLPDMEDFLASLTTCCETREATLSEGLRPGLGERMEEGCCSDTLSE